MVRAQAQLRDRAPLVRLLALGLAATCILAPLASLSHLAGQAHIRCQEHGELEDVPSTAHPLEILHEQTSIENGAAPDPRKRHDHCVFGTHARHSQATDSTPTQGVPVILVSRPAFVQPPIHPAPLVAVYRFAPKTSPPA